VTGERAGLPATRGQPSRARRAAAYRRVHSRRHAREAPPRPRARVAPFLLLPDSVLHTAKVPNHAEPFVRLLGWAYLTLGVGYWHGLRELRTGRHPTNAIIVGLVSNGGACALLTYYDVTDGFRSYIDVVRWGAWGSAVVTLIITAGLYGYGLHGTAADVHDTPSSRRR
jgi:hypothetical protein